MFNIDRLIVGIDAVCELFSARFTALERVPGDDLPNRELAARSATCAP
jgi:hypothetical protein